MARSGNPDKGLPAGVKYGIGLWGHLYCRVSGHLHLGTKRRVFGNLVLGKNRVVCCGNVYCAGM